MSTTDILYLIIIVISALGIAGFQYLHNAKTTFKLKAVFALLRFITLFFLGLLLLNPKFKQTSITQEKPRLVVAIDNSKSVAYLNEVIQTSDFLETLKESKLSEKFSVDYLTFGSGINPLKDTLSFRDTHTNISELFSSLSDVYNEVKAPTVIVTDGNQTFGQDYVLSSLTYKQPIYPVVIGDTIQKEDLNVSHIQLNNYTFLTNEFPVEITLNYTGKRTVSKELKVFKENTILYSKPIKFSKDKTTEVVRFNLPAEHIGKQKYTAIISAISEEVNTQNNKRNFSIDVIDERSNVLVVSEISHPDIGAYKKAIEAHQQRKVTLKKPSDNIDLNNYQLVILYQPTSQFKSVIEAINSTGINHMIVAGLHTDWAFLNSVKQNYKRSDVSQTQELTGVLNSDFNLFLHNDIDLNSLPPLEDVYGVIELQDNAHTLLFQRIKGIQTEQPILSFFEKDTKREALFLGEGVWKWRAQSYLNSQSFEVFDEFIGKTIQYLASNTNNERLTIDVSDEFSLGEAQINAQYVDKNYVIDSNATLSCVLTNQKTTEKHAYNFVFKNNRFQLDLKHFPAGLYTYQVNVKGTALKKTGQFVITNFDIEAQFINPDVTKLSQLATNNKLYTISESAKLLSDLLTDEQFKPIQKKSVHQTPLINWKYLLVVLLVLLTFEWLLRKYNGLL